ncbi:MAG TPA: sugar phosphate nucleotidyltransferase [Anaerolineae bacterium]|nr:sugar phosphate nucleotidyltransferase [Anaerolineae bacterium]
MKVIIPLAGFGKRLRPLTYSRPKPLLNVAGKAVLGHVLDKLQGLDIEEIVFIVGYLGQQIEEYVSAHYSFPASYLEQTELLGQAHAIRLARERVQGEVLILFVDTIFEADLSQACGSTCDGVIYCKEVEDPSRFGVVTIGEDGYIARFEEKPKKPVSNLAVIGLYYLKDAGALYSAIDELIERDIKTKGEYFLADALQILVDRGLRFVASTVDVWEDCGTPPAVLHTNRYLLEHGEGNADEVDTVNSVIIPPVHIAASATVENSVIGPYVTIGEGAEVRCSIIRDSIVDAGATIVDAMLDQSLVGEFALVRDRFRRFNVGDSSAVDFSPEP